MPYGDINTNELTDMTNPMVFDRCSGYQNVLEQIAFMISLHQFNLVHLNMLIQQWLQEKVQGC